MINPLTKDEEVGLRQYVEGFHPFLFDPEVVAALLATLDAERALRKEVVDVVHPYDEALREALAEDLKVRFGVAAQREDIGRERAVNIAHESTIATAPETPVSKLYSFCCEHGESWTSYCAQCRTESTKLRAQVADLKARLKAARRQIRPVREESFGALAKLKRATDLRVRDWRKP